MHNEWPPDKTLLEKLYLEDLLDDSEISQLFKVSSCTIWRLRKKLGIKGINPKKRDLLISPQADISSRQLSIILGGLLGDASLKSNSGSSAYLSIGHGQSQRDYIFWTYDQLKDICHSAPEPYFDKRGYVTYSLISESRQDFMEMRNKIYPNGKKIISQWWVEEIDPLALAVWYMDDGSLNYVNKNKSEFAFATNCFSFKEICILKEMLLDRYGILTEIRSSKRPTGSVQNVLFVSEESFKPFTDIIKPHIPDCMTNKVPSEGHRKKLLLRIKSDINKNELLELYSKKRMTQSEIARELGVSVGTVRKYMDIFNVPKRGQSDAQLNGKNSNNSRDPSSGEYLSGAWTDEEIKQASSVFVRIKKTGFPIPKIKDDEFYISAIDRLFSLTFVPEEGLYKYSRSGIYISTHFCPQILFMATKGSLTPSQIYEDKDLFMDCILRTIRYAKKSTDAAIRSGMKTYRGNRCASVFPPTWALAAIRDVFPDRPGLKVLDFSSGFGGRLIGTYCSGATEYVGIDPIKDNIDSCLEIHRIIQRHSNLKKTNFSCKMINGTAEEVLPTLSPGYDLVMTSPPYFDKEIYCQEDSQCYHKFPTYVEWREGWLRKVISHSRDLLNLGGKLVLFITDWAEQTVGSDTRDIMENEFGSLVSCLKFETPSSEYRRKSGKKRVETAWVVTK